jgi:predicted peptidase
VRVTAKKDLDAALARLEKEANSLPETLRADALYPIDYVHNVNRARIDIGTFDVDKEIAAANEIVVASKSGKDPFAARSGDFKRHYVLQTAGEIMPYRLYIPSKYDGTRAFPLIVALHGLGGTEDSMFGQNYAMVPEAEKRGYIMVAPLGYRIDGGYGRVTAGTRRAELSEDDVMEVLARVRKAYKIDDDRIYLMGHSLGGIGTWTLGAKHPEIWAALGPIAGIADPKTVETMRRIPEIVVHGDADNVVPVTGSRGMVAEMKKLGVEVKYIEVPGGSHTNIAGPNIPALFEFFDTHRKHGEPASARN